MKTIEMKRKIADECRNAIRELSVGSSSCNYTWRVAVRLASMAIIAANIAGLDTSQCKGNPDSIREVMYTMAVIRDLCECE